MRPSSEREDYLKIIFELNGHEVFVTNKVIASALNVSAPSVSDMLHKLSVEEMVEYVAYKGAKLTPKGRNIAVDVIRRHRLIECFLYESLGYTLEELDQEAELLEHIESDAFFKRLEAFLQMPSTCPHGGIIPDRKHYKEQQTQTLLDFPEHTTVVIKRIVDNQHVITHLKNSDLRLGDTITIDRIDTLNQIVFFKKDKENKYINFDLAQMIFVEA